MLYDEKPIPDCIFEFAEMLRVLFGYVAIAGSAVIEEYRRRHEGDIQVPGSVSWLCKDMQDQRKYTNNDVDIFIPLHPQLIDKEAEMADITACVRVTPEAEHHSFVYGKPFDQTLRDMLMRVIQPNTRDAFPVVNTMMHIVERAALARGIHMVHPTYSTVYGVAQIDRPYVGGFTNRNSLRGSPIAQSLAFYIAKDGVGISSKMINLVILDILSMRQTTDPIDWGMQVVSLFDISVCKMFIPLINTTGRKAPIMAINPSSSAESDRQSISLCTDEAQYGNYDVCATDVNMICIGDSGIAVRAGEFSMVIQPGSRFLHVLGRLLKYERKGYKCVGVHYHPGCTCIYKAYMSARFDVVKGNTRARGHFNRACLNAMNGAMLPDAVVDYIFEFAALGAPFNVLLQDRIHAHQCTMYYEDRPGFVRLGRTCKPRPGPFRDTVGYSTARAAGRYILLWYRRCTQARLNA